MNDNGISDTKLRETYAANAVFSNAMNIAVKANKHGSYVDDALLLKNKPDVYVMMKNTDDLDTVIDNVATGGYKKSSQTELDSLPTSKDYDEALKYCDNLLSKQEQKAKAEGKVKESQDDISADTSSLGKLDISSSDNGRPIITSPKYNTRGGSTQAPSTSSKNIVGKESVSTIIRPDSVTTYRIDSPRF